MKYLKLFAILLILFTLASIATIIFSPFFASAQTTNLFYLSGSNIRPNVSTWGFQVPSLANKNCIGTDGSGIFQTGTCAGGGGNTFSYPFPNQLGGGNATSSLTGFSGGVLVTASSTFTALTQLSGGASTTQLTTTGPTYLATLAGNVGIGTTSPTALLSVGGNAVASGGVYVTATGVGIGTNGPGFPLDVQTSGTGVQVVSQIKSAGGGFKLGSYGSGWGGFWSSGVTPATNNYALIAHATAGTALNAPSGGTIQFNIADVVKMNLSQTGGFNIGYAQTDPGAGNMIVSGNVGIGTTTPTTSLSVQGNQYTSGTAYFGGAITATSTLTLTAQGTGCATFTSGALSATASSCGTVTAVTGTWPIISSAGATPNLTWGGLATSSPISAASGLLYATGVNTFASVSTSSPVQMSISGNAATVTTNANLSGVVTSSGNTTSYGSQTVGVLGNAATGNTAPMATSTLFGTGTGGQVLMWSNVTNGLVFAATSTSGGSSFGQTMAIDSSGYISATTTGTYGINANAQGTTYGYAIGDQLLGYASSTNGATIFGLGAGGNNATTSASIGNTTAIGYKALNANTGTTNTAVGYQALKLNTSGASNSALGSNALASNLTTSNNSAFGFNALTGNTGSDNSAFGKSALGGTGSGINNSAFGSTALNLLTSGGGNVSVGAESLITLSTGSNNTGIGWRALNNATNNGNTSLGVQTGYNITTGYDNLFLGETQNIGGNAITTGGGNLLVGYNAVGTSTNAMNFLNIGNSFFGNLMGTTTSTSLPTSWSGSCGSNATSPCFGIASSSPFGILSINEYPGVPAFAVGSSTATKFIIDANGSTGIGTSTPGTFFSVQGVLNALTSGLITFLGEIVGKDTINNWIGRISPTTGLSFTAATSTKTWTATSTPLVDSSPITPMRYTGTIQQAQCNLNTFLGVKITINGSVVTPSYFIGSSTVGTINFTANNTFSKGDKVEVDFGTTTTAVVASGVAGGVCNLFLTETP